MKKVLLKFYDKNNLGDDLFIKIITDRYENYFSVILSKNNAFLERVKHLTVHKNKVLYLFYKVGEKILNVRNLWLKMLIKKHDILVNIGGSIFIENNSIHKWRNERYFYQKLTIPYYILGSNFGPYKSPEFVSVVNDILRQAKDVCFRDKISYKLFENLSCTRAATDIVFSLDVSKYEIKNEKIAIFSIINCKSRFNQKITNKYDQEIINMTRQLIEKGYKIIYMSFCKFEGDELAIARIKHRLDKGLVKHIVVFNYNGNLEEALSLIASCEIVIATRFHAVIVGLLFSKKILPIAYDKKTINILDDIKFKNNIIDINNIDKFDGNKFDFNNLQINNVDEQYQLAELQFQELDKVLIKKNCIHPRGLKRIHCY